MQLLWSQHRGDTPGKALGRTAVTVTPSLALGAGAGLTYQNSLCFLARASGASFLLPAEQPVIKFACDVDSC